MAAELPRNARLFIWFRILFNARFYYPVIAVFFVDLGLTLDEYALLNAAWAASIVVLEIPFGALADRIGRRPLVVGAAAVMVVEMAVLAFAPVGDPKLLFWLFFVNRILSGAAEAAASGADEALAYDTLVAEGCREFWPRVLARLQRRMSLAFMASMIVGAAVYDPVLVNHALRSVGVDASLSQIDTARFPVYLTLGIAVGALITALRMTEPPIEGGARQGATLREGVRQTLGAGRWILGAGFALCVILFSILIDSPGRIVYTFASSIYRMFGIPEYLFGALGAMLGAVGLIAPTIAMWLLRKTTPWAIYGVIAALVVGSLFGLAMGSAWLGVGCMALMGIGFNLLGFFTSHYLNLVAPSETRATILSFRSLATNLSYGLFGALYAAAYRWAAADAGLSVLDPKAVDVVLPRTLLWIPALFVVLLVPVFIGARWSSRMCVCEVPGSAGAGD
ncbi:MAG: MFS transporter [Planctomycetota bacterium]|jgi:MFS family permease